MRLPYLLHVLLVLLTAVCLTVFEDINTFVDSTYMNFTKNVHLWGEGYQHTTGNEPQGLPFMANYHRTIRPNVRKRRSLKKPSPTIKYNTYNSANTNRTMSITTNTAPVKTTNTTRRNTTATATPPHASTTTTTSATTTASAYTISLRPYLSFISLKRRKRSLFSDGEVEIKSVLLACIFAMIALLLILVVVVLAVLIRRHRLEKRYEKTKKCLEKPPRQMDAADINATKFSHGGVLVLDRKLKGPVQHACENQETGTLKSLEFDPNLNEIVNIGSDVEILSGTTTDDDSTGDGIMKATLSFQNLKSFVVQRTARKNPAVGKQLKRASSSGNRKPETDTRKSKPGNAVKQLCEKSKSVRKPAASKKNASKTHEASSRVKKAVGSMKSGSKH